MSRSLMNIVALCVVTGALLVICGCQGPAESKRTLTPDTVAVKNTPYSGEQYRVALGKFENRTPYLTGIFADGPDKIGLQARTNLAAHVAMSNRFVVVDRLNVDELAMEAEIAGQPQSLIGAQVVLTGAVTEFGRRETGTVGLGGLVGRSRTQTAYAKVTVNALDVRTGQILHSVQGAGEFDLKNEHILGFGSEAGYDATLTDKVLNLAMIEVVNRLVEGLENQAWKPTGQ